MNTAILHTEIQDFIQKNLETDTTRLLLGKSPFAGISTRELAEQIESKKRCQKKLPLWYSTPGIYFPPKISIEQASSQATAMYKANLIQGESLIDLSGGLGIDSYYFSRKARQVVHCEINAELSGIAQHNAGVLEVKNMQFIQGDGLQELLSSAQNFDTIYVDPSRRVNTQKVFLLEDCEPNVPGNLDLLLSKASRIIIKTSPLLDIHSGLQELKQVSAVHILSVKNDCKEVIWVIDRDFQGQEPEIICTAINPEETRQYSFKSSEEKEFTVDHYSEPLDFIYEPDVSLLKAGCFKLLTRDFKIQKLHQHTHIYTSTKLESNFIGRQFKLLHCYNYRTFIKENKLKQANIISRNFPLSPLEIKKKHRINDGGQDYLLFTTGPQNDLLVLHCQRLDLA